MNTVTVNSVTCRTVEEYLRQMVEGWQQLSNDHGARTIESFTLNHGQRFTVLPTLPKKYRHFKGRVRECFMNAAHACLTDHELTYVEGYAVGIIPVHHAWAVTPEGDALELTWPEPGFDYFGVPFKRSFLMRRLCEQKYYGLLDGWPEGYPLVRGRFPKPTWYHPVNNQPA